MTNRLSVQLGGPIGIPAPDSHGAFIIEHYWGYTDRGHGRVDEYKVEHPKWELFTVEDERIHVDFAAIYGDDFAFLTTAEPYSVLLAEGSGSSVDSIAMDGIELPEILGIAVSPGDPVPLSELRGEPSSGPAPRRLPVPMVPETC